MKIQRCDIKIQRGVIIVILYLKYKYRSGKKPDSPDMLSIVHEIKTSLHSKYK
jgi:hypothetical protein